MLTLSCRNSIDSDKRPPRKTNVMSSLDERDSIIPTSRSLIWLRMSLDRLVICRWGFAKKSKSPINPSILMIRRRFRCQENNDQIRVYWRLILSLMDLADPRIRRSIYPIMKSVSIRLISIRIKGNLSKTSLILQAQRRTLSYSKGLLSLKSRFDRLRRNTRRNWSS